MYTHNLHKLPKQTIEILVKLPWSDIEKDYSKAFDVIHAGFSFEGFRKGNVPKSIAEKHISKDTVYNQLIRMILPQIYEEIVKKEDIKPVISPKIELVKAQENEEWEIKFVTAEKPVVHLGDYKKAVQEAKKNAKKADIWVPGQDVQKKPEDEEKQKQHALQESLSALLKEAKVDISDLIIEEELNNRLTRLVDDIQKIGLSIDNYLSSKKTTLDELKTQYAQEIKETYSMEFILQAIADEEKITVDQADMDKLFGHIKDEKEKQAAQANAYFYASILRKQKVLDFLNSL